MKLIKCIIILFFFTTGIVFGQTTPPNYVDIDGKDYYRHGYNSSNPSGTPDPQEIRDSVTVTSVIKYFVLPNPAVSPQYDPNDIDNFTNVNSTFSWSLRNTSPLGTIPSGSTTPIVTVTWGSTTGIDTIKALETPNWSAACASSPTAIPVAVIRKPEIAFATKNSIYADSACYTQTQLTTGISIPFSMNATTESSQIWVNYTVTKDNVAEPSLNGSNVPVVGGNISLIFNDYGRYVITITKVTDRISRKSTDVSGNPIEGNITTVGEKFTYTVMRPVETGPIYRIPNNY